MKWHWILLAQLLCLGGTPGLGQDCVPTFYRSEPRDSDWFYGAGKGADAQGARLDALRHLVLKVTVGDESVPAQVLAGWEQDDHGECRGYSYALVRIEKAAVKRNLAGLRLRKKEEPAAAQGPSEQLTALILRLEKQERPPVVVNNNITLSASATAALEQKAPQERDWALKYVVLAVAFLGFIIGCIVLMNRPKTAAPAPVYVPRAAAPPIPASGREVRRLDYHNALRAMHAGCERGCVSVGGLRYRVEGRVGQGDGADVFLARRASPLTELVVLKVQRGRDAAEFLRREHDALQALARSAAQGAPYFSTRVPQVVGFGELTSDGSSAQPSALVLRRHSGFIETLADLARAFPQGLDARHAVWIWRRVLEVLDWVHRSGYVHGAVVPQHLLVNARDHGVMLLDWSCAGRPGEPLRALAGGGEEFYPAHAKLSSHMDLAMTARCVAYALSGGAGRMPASTPGPLAQLLASYLDGSAGPADDAGRLNELVSRAAQEAFGPPRFVELKTPAWERR